MMCVVCKPNSGQQVDAAFSRGVGRVTVNMDRRLHEVFKGGEMLEQIELLEDNADLCLGASFGEVPRRAQHAFDILVADGLAGNGNLATVQMLEMIDQTQQRA